MFMFVYVLCALTIIEVLKDLKLDQMMAKPNS